MHTAAAPIRILHLENNESDSGLVERHLAKAGLSFSLKRVETPEEYVRMLEDFRPDLVLSDNRLAAFDSRGALLMLRAEHVETPFILVSGTVGEERAAELLTNGATDYVRKDRLGRLTPAIERALVIARERAARRRAQQALQASEELFRQLADAMPQIVWAAGSDGEVDYFNQRWYDFTGQPQGQVGLKHWESILHSDDRGHAMHRYGAAMLSGDAY